MQKLRPDMDIGGRIGALRKAAGLTQDQTVARMQVMGLEISKSSYAKIETNRMNLKISELTALREIFQTDYNAYRVGTQVDHRPRRRPGGGLSLSRRGGFS